MLFKKKFFCQFGPFSQHSLQVIRADGKCGLYSWMMRNFISEAFRTAKYNELQELTYLTYPEKKSKTTGEIEPRNMPDFIAYYRMALEISRMDYGALHNQREEFLRRIPSLIVQEIKRWMAIPGNMDPTMDQIFELARNHQSQMDNALFYAKVAPLTKKNQGSQRQKARDYTQMMYEMNNLIISPENSYEYNIGRNLCTEQYEAQIAEMEANNISRTFSGGPRRKGNGFGGTFKTDSTLCFNCGNEGHWAKDCPHKKQKPKTKAMTRSQSKDRKGRSRFNNNK